MVVNLPYKHSRHRLRSVNSNELDSVRLARRLPEKKGQKIKKIKAMAEKQENQVSAPPAKSRRDQFGERLKKKYPDREYADDEALFGQIDDDYAAYEDQIGQYKDRERRVTDLFTKDPGSANFLVDMANGKDPFIGVIERLGIDGVTDLLNNPEKQAEYAEANKKHLERVAKSREFDAEYERNMREQTLPLLDRVMQERGLNDETMDAAWDLLRNIANEAILGKLSESTLDMALRAITHDADVANARSEGAVAGRNAKIKETLRKAGSGDGMPALTGSHNAPASESRRALNIFDYAEAAR